MKPIPPKVIGGVVPSRWSRVTYAEDQPEYLKLPVLKSESPEGYVMSCWRLTFWERLQILFGADFYLTQMTFHSSLQPLMPEIDRQAPKWIIMDPTRGTY